MKRISFLFSCAAMAASWLLLAGTQTMLAQRPGSMPMQPSPPQNNMQQNNMTPNNGMRNQQMNQQTREEMNFIANVRRNSKVETDLSKMALKNSGNDQVKQFAQQVIAGNHRNDTNLANANSQMSDTMFPAPVPSETHKAEKQMKKLTGTDFDKLYIGQMDGYIKNDQQITSEAASTITGGNLAAVTMQLRNTADDRMKQLTQVAQSENFKIQ